MSQIRSISPDVSADEAMSILDRDGAVIYERLLDDETIDRLQAELDAYLARSYLGEGEFWGFRTKRVGALYQRS